MTGTDRHDGERHGFEYEQGLVIETGGEGTDEEWGHKEPENVDHLSLEEMEERLGVKVN
ncbi:MAG TPA: hypothetical protein VNH82_06610 [Candidatus Dormibacteraeota bacterium]|nr:hypothetical protein [Candidatus Dormibacteraeota bacterium]